MSDLFEQHHRAFLDSIQPGNSFIILMSEIAVTFKIIEQAQKKTPRQMFYPIDYSCGMIIDDLAERNLIHTESEVKNVFNQFFIHPREREASNLANGSIVICLREKEVSSSVLKLWKNKQEANAFKTQKIEIIENNEREEFQDTFIRVSKESLEKWIKKPYISLIERDISHVEFFCATMLKKICDDELKKQAQQNKLYSLSKNQKLIDYRFI
jgi:hypothetical protein